MDSFHFSQHRAVANFTKSLDPNRPITAAIAVSANDDKAVSCVHFENEIDFILQKQ